MNYRTSEIAGKIGVHPNTVRLYEKLKCIPSVHREKNGYRIFTDEHLDHLILIQLALRCSIIQNDLRKQAFEIILVAATRDIEGAIILTHNYLKNMRIDKMRAEKAVDLVHCMLEGKTYEENENVSLTRSETAKFLGISIDILRNWERNGLVEVPRKKNGYRVYTNKEIHMLQIVQTLRFANYSMMSILRMLNHVNHAKYQTSNELKQIIDTPDSNDDIVYITDKLITSLNEAEQDIEQMLVQLTKMKRRK